MNLRRRLSKFSGALEHLDILARMTASTFNQLLILALAFFGAWIDSTPAGKLKEASAFHSPTEVSLSDI